MSLNNRKGVINNFRDRKSLMSRQCRQVSDNQKKSVELMLTPNGYST